MLVKLKALENVDVEIGKYYVKAARRRCVYFVIRILNSNNIIDKTYCFALM